MGEKFSVDTSENRRLKQSIEQYADRAIEGIHDYLYSLLTDDLMIPCDDGDERETVIGNELRGVEYIIKKELDGLKFWDKRERLFEYTVHRGLHPSERSIQRGQTPAAPATQGLYNPEAGQDETVQKLLPRKRSRAHRGTGGLGRGAGENQTEHGP